MIEQFLVSVPEDIRIWLHERKPASTRQAVGLADYHALAHKCNQKANPKTFSSSPSLIGTHTLENSGRSLGSKDHPLGKLMRNQTNLHGDKSVFSVTSLAIQCIVAQIARDMSKPMLG